MKPDYLCPFCRLKIKNNQIKNSESFFNNIVLCFRCGEVLELKNDQLVHFNLWSFDEETIKNIRYKQYKLSLIRWKKNQIGLS